MREFVTSHRALFVGALITGVTPFLLALKDFDPNQITDPKAWAVGIGAASVRQLAVFILARLVVE